MRDYVPFLIFGIAAGSVYGICAMGLVLTYKTSGVFNIGHGAICAAAAYTFHDLHTRGGLSWPLAGLIVLGVGGPIAGLILERLAAALAPVSTAYKIVATVGLLVFIQAAIVLKYTGQGLVVRPFLPQETAFTLSGVRVRYDSVITLAIGMIAAIGLYLFFRLTRLGTAIRGVVDDPQLLDMTGYSPTSIRRTAWVIGSVFAAASGILFASVEQQLEVNVLSLLVVQAFGAATIALFRNLPMCFVGGLIVALVQKLVAKDLDNGDYVQLAGLNLTIPFLVLFGGLLVIPRRYLVEVGRAVKQRAASDSVLPVGMRRLGALASLGVALSIPAWAGSHIAAWDVALSSVALFMSLHLLVRISGQISLCQFAFAAVGAATFAHMQADGVPFGLCVLIGGLVCLPVALVISVPAIRLSGLYLALATLGLGTIGTQFFFYKDYMFGTGVLETHRPSLWGLDGNSHYFYALLAVAVVAVAAVIVIERSRLGRLLRGMADAPVALSTLGLSVNVSRVIVFCIAGFMAGISGGLYASMFGGVSKSDFIYVQSLVVLAVMAISGRSTVQVAVVAPILLYVVPNYITGEHVGTILQLLFGLAAILAAIGSQGAYQRWAASMAARFADRRTGPASVRLEEYRRGTHRPLVGTR